MMPYPEQSGEFSERRRSLRVTPDPLLIIRLPSGNHGIVLDLSRDGLGLLSYAPIEEAHPLRFEISGKALPGAAATGDLVWKDGSSKRAGIRFTELSDELRALIRRSLPLEEAPVQNRTPPGEVQDFPPLAGAVHSRRLRFAANAVTTLLALLIALAIGYSIDRRGTARSFDHLKRGFSAFWSMKIHPAPHWLTRPAGAREKLPALPAPVVEKTTVIPVPPSDPPVPAASPQQNVLVPIATTPQAASRESPQPVPATGVEPQEQRAEAPHSPPIASDASQTQLQLAQTLLQDDSDQESQAKAVGLLWKAVEKGNAAAEIELADLYLRGQIVPKNCSQARVLLTAAQSRKSELARQKLSELASYDCE